MLADNLCLSLYYMLVVKYKYSEKQVKKIEPYLQIVPNLAGIGTAFYGLFHGIYGSAMLWCWIEPDDTQYRCVYRREVSIGLDGAKCSQDSISLDGPCITFHSGL